MWLRYELYMPSYGTMRKNVISQPYSRVQDIFDQQVGEIKPSSLAISYHLKSILVGNQRNMTTSTTFVHGFANKTPPTKKKKIPDFVVKTPKKRKKFIHRLSGKTAALWYLVSSSNMWIFVGLWWHQVFFGKLLPKGKVTRLTKVSKFCLQKNELENVGDTSGPRHLIWIPPKKKSTNMSPKKGLFQ